MIRSGAVPSGYFCAKSAQAIENKGVEIFLGPDVRKSMKTKGCPSLGSGRGRMAANRNGEHAIKETNSSVEQKERGMSFIVRELRWRLQLRANRASVFAGILCL